MRPILAYAVTLTLAACSLPQGEQTPADRSSKPTGESYADRCEEEETAARSTSFLAVSGARSEPFDAVALVTLSSGEVCSAVLVAPDKLVTAAHCFENGVTVRQVAFEKGLPLKATALHPAYEAALKRGETLAKNPALGSFDVATLTLAAPVEDRKPVRIYRGEALSKGKLLSLVGYGDTGLGAGTKRFAQTHVGRWIDRDSAFGENFHDLLLLDSRSGSGACPGDSGGGVFAKTPAGYELVGVVDGVNDLLYPGFPVSTCDRCPQGIGVITRLAGHGEFLGI